MATGVVEQRKLMRTFAELRANLLAKAIIFLAQREFADGVVGATVPILIPSRAESARDRVNSMALGAIYAAG